MTTTQAMHNATWSRQDDRRSGAADAPTSSHDTAVVKRFVFDIPVGIPLGAPLLWNAMQPRSADSRTSIKDSLFLDCIFEDTEDEDFSSDEEESLSGDENVHLDEAVEKVLMQSDSFRNISGRGIRIVRSRQQRPRHDPLITIKREDSIPKITRRGRRVVMTHPNKVHEDKLITRFLKRTENSSSKNHGNVGRGQRTVKVSSPDNSSQNPLMNFLNKSDSLKQIVGRGTRIVSTLPTKSPDGEFIARCA